MTQVLRWQYLRPFPGLKRLNSLGARLMAIDGKWAGSSARTIKFVPAAIRVGGMPPPFVSLPAGFELALFQ